MNKAILKNPVSHSRGITLIEILMVLGLLVILVSFAMPSISGTVNTAEMKAATENVQWSLQIARKTARMTETPVSMNISPADQGRVQTITFASPGEEKPANTIHLQDFSLPLEIMLVSDSDSYLFDKRGQVENPGRILLVATADESVTSTIEVE